MNRPLVVFACLVAVGCGGGSGAPDAGADPRDAGASGSDAAVGDAGEGADGAMPLDAAVPPDAAMPPDAAAITYDAGPRCSSQAECGDPIANWVANVCVGSHCRATAPTLVNVTFESYYDQSFSQAGARPQVQLTRLLLSTRVDGSPLTCADVLAKSGSTQATRDQLDKDPEINQAFRNLTVLTWSGSTQGQTLFRLYYDAPRAPGLLVLGEAWYGPRDGNYPTGGRASVYCAERIDLTASATPKVPILFKP